MFWKEKKTIITHSGHFHPDEIFAVAVLRIILENKYKLEIIRTRDEEIIKRGDYVVDVGMVYDKEKNRFDHHQLFGAGVRENGIPFASFGLVWERYGMEVSLNNKDIFNKINKMLVLPIDALDNGVLIERSINGIEDYTIFDYFNSFNPTWKEGYEKSLEKFIFLTGVAKEIIKREVKIIKDNLESKMEVEKIYRESKDKRLLILDKQYYIKDVVYDNVDILLIIYYNQNENNWHIRCAKDAKMSFISRISFPDSWAGKRDEDLEKETGVDGSIFCHKGKFFMVMKTKEGAIEIAKKVIPNLNI